MVKLNIHFLLTLFAAFACGAFVPSSRNLNFPQQQQQHTCSRHYLASTSNPTTTSTSSRTLLIRCASTSKEEEGSNISNNDKRTLWQATKHRTKQFVSSSLRFVGVLGTNRGRRDVSTYDVDDVDYLPLVVESSGLDDMSLWQSTRRRIRRGASLAMLMVALTTAASRQEASASPSFYENDIQEVRFVSTTAKAPEEVDFEDATIMDEQEEAFELDGEEDGGDDDVFDDFDEAALEEELEAQEAASSAAAMSSKRRAPNSTKRSKKKILTIGACIGIPAMIPRFLHENYRYRRDSRNVKKALAIRAARKAEYQKSLSNKTDDEIGQDLADAKKNSTSTKGSAGGGGDDDKPRKKKKKKKGKRPKGPSGSDKGNGPDSGRPKRKRKPKKPKGGGGSSGGAK